MPVNEAPDDDAVRHSYNFAPGYHGLVYRADGPDTGGRFEPKDDGETKHLGDGKYKLQAMQWGLVPFWTKRNPDYGSRMKTINCRDDSLPEDRGMWTTMKKKKRCIVIAQGFYEWLKKNGSKDKIPHFTKRKDGQLMCFAGLWDCVQFEDSAEKLFTYTIITTNSNKQLAFLHDRMPVILDNGSDAIRTWLNSSRMEWDKELQSLLRPYDGELECFPVSKDVGKVGNNSPSFLVPINSAANKNNIANFFGKQHQDAQSDVKQNLKSPTKPGQMKVQRDVNETRATTDHIQGTEDNAPLPVPASPGLQTSTGLQGIKREHNDEDIDGRTAVSEPQPKMRRSALSSSPTKTSAKKQSTKSATSNGSAARTPTKGDGSRKITSFFGNK